MFNDFLNALLTALGTFVGFFVMFGIPLIIAELSDKKQKK